MTADKSPADVAVDRILHESAGFPRIKTRGRDIYKEMRADYVSKINEAFAEKDKQFDAMAACITNTVIFGGKDEIELAQSYGLTDSDGNLITEITEAARRHEEKEG